MIDFSERTCLCEQLKKDSTTYIFMSFVLILKLIVAGMNIGSQQQMRINQMLGAQGAQGSAQGASQAQGTAISRGPRNQSSTTTPTEARTAGNN